jgi:glycerol-3-phosphate O-acyltransferase
MLRNLHLTLDYLEHRDVPFSPSMKLPIWSLVETIAMMKREGAVKVHLVGEETIYTIDERRRLNMNFYKNNIIHHFFAPSSIALAYLSFGQPSVDLGELKERVRFLSRLFKFEIIYPPQQNFDTLFESTLTFFEEQGSIRTKDDRAETTQTTYELFDFYRNIISNYLESYWVCVRTLPILLEGRMSEKTFLKKVMQTGQRAQILGEISHVESFSKTNYLNAIKYLVARGLLLRDQLYDATSITALPIEVLENPKRMKRVTKKARWFVDLPLDCSDPEKLKSIAEEIGQYLQLRQVRALYHQEQPEITDASA